MAHAKLPCTSASRRVTKSPNKGTTASQNTVSLSVVTASGAVGMFVVQDKKRRWLSASFLQAIAKYVEAEALAVLAQEFEVRTAVVINEENILTAVAAPNNVVRLTRDNDSSNTKHAETPPDPSPMVKK